jgi:hypothetical protein
MEESKDSYLHSNRPLFWKGVSNKERNETILEIEKLINRFGYITDFKLFSDIEMTLTIELKESAILPLYIDMKEVLEMSEFPYIQSDSERERVIFLNLTFLLGSGNKRNEVPAIPG